MALLPEIIVCGVILLLFVWDLFAGETGKKHLGLIGAGGLGLALIAAVWLRGAEESAFAGAYHADALAAWFKIFFLACGAVVVLMSREYVQRFDRGTGEYYILLALATLGMMMLACAANLLALFVSLELISISFYVLTAFHHQQERSLEAGTKYLVLSALSSALLLYGISFVYGATGSVNFAAITQAAQSGGLSDLASFGLVLIVSGVGFKIACVPFQLWVPDVYQGAPTPTVAFLSVGSKAAGFVILLRVLTGMFGPASTPQSVWVLSLLAAMTIFYGNLGALRQHNFKRLLGYSSIGHAGYVLIGFAAGSALGAGAVVFYLTAYLFTNLAAFLVLVVVARNVAGEEIAQFNGLAKRSPFLAAAMFLALLSLAGVPPLAGFTAKFLLLLSAVESGLVWLAVIGAVNVVISLYYYLMIVNAMYLKAPQTEEAIPLRRMTKAAIVACLAGIVGMGLVAEPFAHVAMAAVKGLF